MHGRPRGRPVTEGGPGARPRRPAPPCCSGAPATPRAPPGSRACAFLRPRTATATLVPCARHPPAVGEEVLARGPGPGAFPPHGSDTTAIPRHPGVMRVVHPTASSPSSCCCPSTGSCPAMPEAQQAKLAQPQQGAQPTLVSPHPVNPLTLCFPSVRRTLTARTKSFASRCVMSSIPAEVWYRRPNPCHRHHTSKRASSVSFYLSPSLLSLKSECLV